MTREFCPKCRCHQNMLITDTPGIKKVIDGETYTLFVRIYHCSVCHMFVKSDNISQKESLIKKIDENNSDIEINNESLIKPAYTE